MDDVLSMVERVAGEYSARTGARICVEEIQRHESGKPSSTSNVAYLALSKAVCDVLGDMPTAVGVGGGTCANFFRLRGFDAYVWQCGGGTLHAPNEYVEMSNIISDAKVFATLYHRLCVE